MDTSQLKACTFLAIGDTEDGSLAAHALVIKLKSGTIPEHCFSPSVTPRDWSAANAVEANAQRESGASKALWALATLPATGLLLAVAKGWL